MQRENLEKLNIHELRIKARALGVKAPTTKKQGQLIEEILQIENGELAAVKSKMGRPPKNQGVGLDKFTKAVSEKSLMDLKNSGLPKVSDTMWSDSYDYTGMIVEDHDYMGVVRVVDDVSYLKNNICGLEYIYLDNQDCKLGDLISGKCHAISRTFGKVDTCEKLQFKNADGKDSFCIIKELPSVENMYDDVESSQENNKIIVEIEANIYSSYDFSQTQKLYFHTNECEDLINSYNLLIDIKNLVNNLCDENKKFSLYLIDIEYIYSTLSIYFEMKGALKDINAGQYFKELLSKIYNSNGGQLVIYEKKGCKRSSYLDLILNKYCEKKN